MNLKAHHPDFKVWAGAQADVDRIVAVWRQCFDAYGGPFLFGARPTIADAMYAPVCTRFRTYDVDLDDTANGYCDTILALPAMRRVDRPPRSGSPTSSRSSTSSSNRARPRRTCAARVRRHRRGEQELGAHPRPRGRLGPGRISSGVPTHPVVPSVVAGQ